MSVTKRFRVAAIVLVLLVLGGLGWWRFGTHHVPEGQPALVTIDAQALTALKEDFNRASAGTRMIVLLSPT